MKYLFWNINKKDLSIPITKLLSEYQCDFVAFSEMDIDSDLLLRSLTSLNLSYYPITVMCDRIKIFTRFSPEWIRPLHDSSYYTILKVRHESLGYHIVAVVHFPSKLYADEYDHMSQARTLKSEIEALEQAENIVQTVIFGDFNMNPFEEGMVNADTLFTVPCRNVASIRSRKIKGQDYSMFYNPMWSMFGDQHAPPGTYFYSQASIKSYYWHLFDQVIIRPSLTDSFPLDKLKIIYSVKGLSLTNDKGYPDASDHLPLYFEIL